jgi:predicted HTH domain antitoxin
VGGWMDRILGSDSRREGASMMQTVTLELEDDLVALLQQADQPIPRVAKEMIVLELYRRRVISSGKAASLLGMDRFEFVRHASHLGIPFFDMTDEEWKREMKVIETL